MKTTVVVKAAAATKAVVPVATAVTKAAKGGIQGMFTPLPENPRKPKLPMSMAFALVVLGAFTATLFSELLQSTVVSKVGLYENASMSAPLAPLVLTASENYTGITGLTMVMQLSYRIDDVRDEKDKQFLNRTVSFGVRVGENLDMFAGLGTLNVIYKPKIRSKVFPEQGPDSWFPASNCVCIANEALGTVAECSSAQKYCYLNSSIENKECPKTYIRSYNGEQYVPCWRESVGTCYISYSVDSGPITGIIATDPPDQPCDMLLDPFDTYEYVSIGNSYSSLITFLDVSEGTENIHTTIRWNVKGLKQPAVQPDQLALLMSGSVLQSIDAQFMEEFERMLPNVPSINTIEIKASFLTAAGVALSLAGTVITILKMVASHVGMEDEIKDAPSYNNNMIELQAREGKGADCGRASSSANTDPEEEAASNPETTVRIP